MIVGTVGSITEGKQANQLLDEGLDVVTVGRMFQKNPALVWYWAEELGVQINVANQIGGALGEDLARRSLGRSPYSSAGLSSISVS